MKTNLIRNIRIGLVLAALILCVTGSSAPAPISKFDEFGDIKCEDEMARLDNFAVQLQHEPSARGVIIFYGGRRFRGRLPRRGEAAARAARIKPYLVQRRGIPTDQVMVIDGGFGEEFKVELWVVPPGATMPTPGPTIPIEKIKFRKGKANPRDYQCGV
jgi:hypothetical protein